MSAERPPNDDPILVSDMALTSDAARDREKYRVCLYTEGQQTRVGLCQVAADEDGTVRCVEVASTEVFATVADLKRGLERMRSACELPAIEIEGSDQRADCFEQSLVAEAIDE